MTPPGETDPETPAAATVALPAGHTLSVDTLAPASEAPTQGAIAAPEGARHGRPFAPFPDTGSMPGSPSRMLGRYRDLGMVGRGGMGEVRRVFDPELRRTLVMKLIHPELIDQPLPCDRFISEARIQAGLQHAAIVPVHEIARLDDGRFYFTMKEISGRTLGERTRDAHARTGDRAATEESVKELLRIFVRVAEAVAYAHSRGVIHRDLKPDNIMVGEFGEVQVVDWGLATVFRETPGGPSAPPSPAGVAGTPAYMPPEQAAGSATALSPLADIYSLGAILYELIAGRPPYEGASAMEVLTLVIHTEPLPLEHAVTREVPEPLLEACRAAMAREPSARPDDAAWLAQRVAGWLSGADARERADEVVTAAASLRSEAQRLEDAGGPLWTAAPDLGDPDLVWSAWSALVEHRLDIDARIAEAAATLEGALAHDARHTTAHHQLAGLHHARLVEARRERQVQLAAAHEARMEHHLSLLEPSARTRLRERLEQDQQDIGSAGRLLDGATIGRIGLLGALDAWWAGPSASPTAVLVGFAGVGKSRVALALAQRLQRTGARAVYCPIGDHQTGARLEDRLRASLRVPDRQSLPDALAAQVREAPCLVILDHVDTALDAACRLAGELCGTVHGLRVLMTSRKRPIRPDPRVFTVRPMPSLEAAMLLRSRMLRAGATDPARDPLRTHRLVEDATALGGVPLAIELAAPLLSAGKAEGGARSVLQILDASVDSALSRTLAWSWDQLDAPEQEGLARLCRIPTGVPMGIAGFLLQNGDRRTADLQALRDAGLVSEEVDPGGNSTLQVPLHIREYVAHCSTDAQLPEDPDLFDRLARYLAGMPAVSAAREAGELSEDSVVSDPMLALLQTVAVRSSTAAGVRCGLAALQRLTRYRSSREALSFADALLDHACLTPADRLAVQLDRLPVLRIAGRVDEALEALGALETVLAADPELDASPRATARLEARARNERALAARELGRFEEALEHFQAAHALYTRHGWTSDARSISASAMDLYRISSRIEEGLDAVLQWGPGELEGLEADDLSSTLHDLAAALRDAARYEEALQFLRSARAAADRARSQKHIAMCLALEASIRDEQGAWSEAVPLYNEAVRIHQRMGNVRSMAIGMTNLGAALCRDDDPAAGIALLQRAATIHHEAGRPRSEAIALGLLGAELHRQGRTAEAGVPLKRAVELARATIPYAGAAFSADLALVESSVGDHDGALRRLASAESLLTEHPDELGRLLCKRAVVELAAGERDRAAHALAQAVELAGRLRLGPQAPMRLLIADLAPRLPEVDPEPRFTYTSDPELAALAESGAYPDLVSMSVMDLAAAEAAGDLERVFHHGWWVIEGRFRQGHLGSARFLSDTLLQREPGPTAGTPCALAKLRLHVQRVGLDVRSARPADALTLAADIQAEVEQSGDTDLKVALLCVTSEARIALGRPEDAVPQLRAAVTSGVPGIATSAAVHRALAAVLDAAGQPFEALASYSAAEDREQQGPDAVVARWHRVAAAARVDDARPAAPTDRQVQGLSRAQLIVVRTLQCEVAFLDGDPDLLRERSAALSSLTLRRGTVHSVQSHDSLQQRVLSLIGNTRGHAEPVVSAGSQLVDARLEETRLLASHGRWEEALDLARRLETEAREGLDTPARGLAERNLGLLLRQCGRPQASVPWLVRARARGRLSGDRVLEARAQASLGCTWMALDRPDQAATVLHEALELSESVRTGNESVGIIADLINAERGRGRLEEAEALARRGISMAVQRGDRAHEAAVRIGLATVLKAQGKIDEARQQWATARESSLETGLHYIAAVTTFNLAETDLDAGRSADAEATARTWLESGTPMLDDARHLFELLLANARLEQGHGDEADIRRLTQRRLVQTGELRWSSEYYLGRIHLALGQRAEAEACLENLLATTVKGDHGEVQRMTDDLTRRLAARPAEDGPGT